jgi:hypothetical protein
VADKFENLHLHFDHKLTTIDLDRTEMTFQQ